MKGRRLSEQEKAELKWELETKAMVQAGARRFWRKRGRTAMPNTITVKPAFI
jgi:hypothetical protein